MDEVCRVAGKRIHLGGANTGRPDLGVFGDLTPPAKLYLRVESWHFTLAGLTKTLVMAIASHAPD